MTIKGNEPCWDMLQRVFELAATHGGFDPSTLQAQFGSAVVEGNKNLQMVEKAAERQADPDADGGAAPDDPLPDGGVAPPPKEPYHI